MKTVDHLAPSETGRIAQRIPPTEDGLMDGSKIPDNENQHVSETCKTAGSPQPRTDSDENILQPFFDSLPCEEVEIANKPIIDP